MAKTASGAFLLALIASGVATGAASGVAPAMAAAQEADADEVVITGERRARPVDQQSENTAIVGADRLQTIGAQHPSEALNTAPGVGFHRGSGVETLPAIRSPVLTGGQGAGSILVLEDGVPIRAPGFANINQEFESSWDFADRLEVTRGPGSALYGSNAVHGTINVITPAAGRNLGAPRLLTSAEVGSFGRARATLERRFGLSSGWVDCVLIDSTGAEYPDTCEVHQTPIRGFLGISAAHEDGWRDDAGLDQQRALVKAKIELGGWDAEAALVAMNMNQETAGFVEGADAYSSTALSRRNANPEAFRDEKLARAQVSLSGPLGAHGKLALTPFARWIDTDLLMHFFPSRALEETGQTGWGVQAAYYYDPSAALSWIVGADLDRTRGRLREVQARATQPNGYLQGVHYAYDVDASALASYAQVNWEFARAWRVVAGLRGEKIRYDYDNQANDGDFGRFRRPSDRKDEFTAVTPKLGLVRAFDAGGSVYLNLARGARAPQASDLYSLQTLQQPGEQASETIDSVEIGLRKPIGAGRFEISLYHMDKRHSSFRNGDGYTVPDARTRHQGVEASGRYPLSDRLTASGWIAYGVHTYRFNDPVSRAGESIGFGDDVDSAPRWLWNAALAYSPVAGVSSELEWAHTGEYFTNAANTRAYAGHEVFNLRLTFDVSDGSALFVAVRNLTNTDYAERADFAFGNDRYFPGEDRAFTIGLRTQIP